MLKFTSSFYEEIRKPSQINKNIGKNGHDISALM